MEGKDVGFLPGISTGKREKERLSAKKMKREGNNLSTNYAKEGINARYDLYFRRR